MVKNPPAGARDAGYIPGLGRSPGERNGNPLQYSCLENPMDRGAWQATVYGVAKSQTQISNWAWAPVQVYQSIELSIHQSIHLSIYWPNNRLTDESPSKYYLNTSLYMWSLSIYLIYPLDFHIQLYIERAYKENHRWCTNIDTDILVAQMVKNLPAMQETQVQSLAWEDPLEKGMATHSSILAWRMPWTEEPGGLQSMGLQRVRHDWATDTTTVLQAISF